MHHLLRRPLIVGVLVTVAPLVFLMVRRSLHLAFAAAILATGCNSLFGIHEGHPRPICVAGDDALEPMIDDMEDGDGFICELNGRNGHWYSFSDGTSTELTPPGDFDPTLIPGGRGSSRYAAHLAGSGFTEWGAAMGLNMHGVRQPYDATTAEGIKFWLKSTVPVDVLLQTLETYDASFGGHCEDTPSPLNCNNPFAFSITTPGSDWVEYEVPFTAFGQYAGGTLRWNPRDLVAIQFSVPPGATFDVWVDDLRFYRCPGTGCLPTCSDPAVPVSCPASANFRPACVATAADCVRGCSASNTVAAPAGGLVTSFDGAGGGANITTVRGDAIVGPPGAAPAITTNGALHITVDAPVLSTAQVLAAHFLFQDCVDASAFTGVQFSISGSVSGCALVQVTQDSAHLPYDPSSAEPTRHGTAAAGGRPHTTRLTADQITSAPQTLRMPFAGQSGGVPATPIDTSKLTRMAWAFVVDPASVGGPTSCTADVVVDDVRFY